MSEVCKSCGRPCNVVCSVCGRDNYEEEADLSTPVVPEVRQTKGLHCTCKCHRDVSQNRSFGGGLWCMKCRWEHETKPVPEVSQTDEPDLTSTAERRFCAAVIKKDSDPAFVYRMVTLFLEAVSEKMLKPTVEVTGEGTLPPLGPNLNFTERQRVITLSHEWKNEGADSYEPFVEIVKRERQILALTAQLAAEREKREAAEGREKVLRDAAYGLANEVDGMIGFREEAWRTILGNTNVAVMQGKVRDVRAALAHAKDAQDSASEVARADNAVTGNQGTSGGNN